ncbi:MAG: hypothetical protein Q4D29_08525 [Lachnospiraceae bacterium]|nr:hypothetical protein [Lachnospiraceae bacterium]
MKKVINRVVKLLVASSLGMVLCMSSSKAVKADELADAIAAQQAIIYQQQLQAIQAYQAALMAQYQQAMADQYAKALLVFNEAQAEQQRAIQQAYMLNAIQQKQKAQYTSMVQNTGLDYQQHLIDEYNKYQKQAVAAFKGYEGIK